MLINRFGRAKPFRLNVNGVAEEYTVPTGENYVLGDIILNEDGYVKGVAQTSGSAGATIIIIVPNSSTDTDGSGGSDSTTGSWHTVWSGSQSVGSATYTGSSFNSSVDFSRPTKVWGYCDGVSGGSAQLTGTVELNPGSGTDSQQGVHITQSSVTGGTLRVYYQANMGVSITTGNLLRVSVSAAVTSQFTSTDGVAGQPSTTVTPCSAYLTRIDQYY